MENKLSLFGLAMTHVGLYLVLEDYRYLIHILRDNGANIKWAVLRSPKAV